MNGKLNLRALAGIAVSTATLLALIPLGSANADPAQLNMGTNTDTTTITITGPAGSLEGHSFKAVKIGDYDNATGNASDHSLASVSVSTVAGVKTDAAAALHSVDSSSPGAGYDGNPVGEVASRWLGYSAASYTNTDKDETSNSGTAANAWNGNLRKFVTNLAAQTDFNTSMGSSSITAGPGGASDTSVQFTGVEPGIYVIEDVTARGVGGSSAHKNSIPMLVSTGIKLKDDATAYMSIGGQALGTVSIKKDEPSVAKALDGSNNDPSVGGTLHYKLTGSVPLTTGYTHYVYTLADNPSQPGLTYNNDAVVKVGNTTLTVGTQYTVDATHMYASPNGASTRYIVFDLTPSIMSFHYQDPITVTYSMKVNDNAAGGALQNGVTLGYSNNPGNQPSSDSSQTGTDGNGDGQVTDCSASGAPSGCTNGSITNNVVPGSSNSGSTAYMRHFDLINEKKIDNSGLEGAKFQVVDSTGHVINFLKMGNGSYKKSVSQSAATGSDPSASAAGTDLTVYAGTAGSSSGDDPISSGQLRVDGLADGDYTVKEVAAAPGFSGTFLPSTKVTLKGNASAPATDAFTNTADVWGLIAAHSTLTDVGMTQNNAVIVWNINSVSQLPLTGGAGVILALLIVVALAIIAAVLIMTRRRLNKQ
ncbi:isopeptide-forming domain-containing fimbrial protein [Bifidobacterium sp. ESL0790]|uniref:isopeptide-forming domain-containing fimbrial protein n=1 Tax=Bifidobacterium sp. ESL0790 TaxID=2983233 RepID=UPI0023F9E5BE|nr:isopeptide-forming domain-containing fimbrial protein [Bifidobacterium sp. ESL0790]WEV72372.1 isopeptide-forming domain-containing fimbrial protein [Bifidobacterium sp. ESL0790]